MADEVSIVITAALICFFIGFIVVLFILSKVKANNKILLQEKQINAFELEKQRLIFSKSLEVEENTRQKIYDNIHDQVNPKLRGIMRRLERHKVDLRKNTLTTENIDHDIDLLISTVLDIKSATHELMPSYLKECGLIHSMAMFMETINLPGTLASSFENLINYNRNVPFSETQQLSIYRIFLETVENVIKHANCSTIHLCIAEIKETLVIRITHNGLGVDNDTIEKLGIHGTGNGLKSSKARSLSLKGIISYEKNHSTSSITISIPFHDEPAH